MTIQANLLVLAFFIFFPLLLRYVFNIRLVGNAALVFWVLGIATFLDLISKFLSF